MTKTATHIRDLKSTFRGHAALYRLSPPIKDWGWNNDKAAPLYEYVVVSAITTMQVDGDGPETYIFPANEDGKIENWGELPGSQKGTLSHEQVLTDAGYNVVTSGPTQ